MLEDESKGADHNQGGLQKDEQNVSRMPEGVVAGFGGLHDVGNVLDDLLLKGVRNLRVSLVLNSFLGINHIVGSLNELDGRQARYGWPARRCS